MSDTAQDILMATVLLESERIKLRAEDGSLTSDDIDRLEVLARVVKTLRTDKPTTVRAGIAATQDDLALAEGG